MPSRREGPSRSSSTAGRGRRPCSCTSGRWGRGSSNSETGRLPPRPPARLSDNAETWLAFTDLVFVDPVGTGYSRGTGTAEETQKQFWGIRPDLEAAANFVRLFLTRASRWDSPRFLAGESYGGFRVAALADMLPRDYGVALNGVILISPVIEFSLIRDDPYRLLPWMARLPSYAATRLLLENGIPAAELGPALREAEAFARSEYLAGLAAGESLAEEERRALYGRVAELIGLPPEIVARHRGRIPMSVFAKRVLGPGRIVSLYDSAYAVPDPHPASERLPRGDPLLDGIVATLTTAFQTYVRAELAFATERPYRVLSGETNRQWDFQGGGERGQGFPGVADELRSALAFDSSLRVLIVHGFTDLVTPYFASRYLLDQMRLDAGLRDNLRLEVLPGGHMMYLSDPVRAALTGKAQAFYAAATPSSPPSRPGSAP